MLTTRGPFNAFLDMPQVAVPNAESGLLAGLSLAVKDIFDVAGYRTGCGNPDRYAEAIPATTTAPAVQMLLNAGARFAGKTQTEELAFSMIGQNVHFPHPENPAALGRVTGGSSSGSVAAVAGGLVDIATGSDTGGSIRAPASFCGLLGLRTTHGAISLDSTMPLSPSLDTFGWFARDIDIYEKVGEVLLGDSPKGEGQRRLFRLPELDALVSGPAEAAEYTRMVGVISDVIGPPSEATSFSIPIEDRYWCLRKIQAYEAWAAHGDWISAKDHGLAPAVMARFAFGKDIDRATYDAETARRATFTAEFADMLGSDGLLALPTVPGAAPLATTTAEGFGTFREQAVRLFCLSGLSGFPQITLPLGTVDNAPFGISLIGPARSDLALIRLGRDILENARQN